MFFTNTFLNSVSTIASESSDVASAAAMENLSNDQDYIEVNHSKTNMNEISSVQDSIKNYLGIITINNFFIESCTEDISFLFVLE